MPRAVESIQTRQRSELLFHAETPPLGGAAFVSPDMLVAGFNAVEVFAVSDQPFDIRILEACRPGGTFVVTQTLHSVASGADQAICTRVLPCGTKMQMALQYTGATGTFLSFCASGLPEP